jgi:hypothetical protein
MNLVHETTTLADAGAMLEACRAELERGGFQSQANALKGFEILSATDAEVALSTLKNMTPAQGGAEDARRYTISALKSALQGSRLAS